MRINRRLMTKMPQRMAAICLLFSCLNCFSQDKDIDPNVLIPMLGKKDHEAVVKLVGDSYEVRSISNLTSFLPLKFQKIQVRGQGVVLLDAEGRSFPVMRTAPPDLRKITSMKAFREVLNLLTCTENELNENRTFVCDINLVEAALEMLKVGEGGNIHIHVAYAANDRIVFVSCTCMYNGVKKGGGLDTPFFESTVSSWMSPRFPVNASK